jgi:hypothetical protein
MNWQKWFSIDLCPSLIIPQPTGLGKKIQGKMEATSEGELRMALAWAGA